MGWREVGFTGLMFAVAVGVYGCGGESSADPGAEPRPPLLEIATCAESVGGSPNQDWRDHATTAGPFGLLGPGRHFRVLREHPNGNFTAKVPAILDARRRVTVRLRTQDRKRIGFDYGDFRTEKGIDRTPTKVIFKPCRDKRGTGWPGGLLITEREPVTLLVRIAGESRIRRLQVGPKP